MELDGKSSEGKDKSPLKSSKGSLGSLNMITGKNNNDPGKTLGASANGGFSQRYTMDAWTFWLLFHTFYLLIMLKKHCSIAGHTIKTKVISAVVKVEAKPQVKEAMPIHKMWGPWLHKFHFLLATNISFSSTVFICIHLCQLNAKHGYAIEISWWIPLFYFHVTRL